MSEVFCKTCHKGEKVRLYQTFSKINKNPQKDFYFKITYKILCWIYRNEKLISQSTKIN